MVFNSIIWLILIVAFFIEIKIINKRLKKIENNDIKTDKLLDWVDKNSFDISSAVKDIKETFEDFHIEYKEVVKMLDSLNCPIYKFKFGKNEIIISYDFKTVTMKLDDGNVTTYTNWNDFKNDLFSALAVRVEFKNEPIVKNEQDTTTLEQVKEIKTEIEIASKLANVNNKSKKKKK